MISASGNYRNLDDEETLLGCSRTAWRTADDIVRIISLPKSAVERSLNRLIAAGKIEVDTQGKLYFRRV